ncbi:hypothetical protein HYW99_01015 [Candidatus Woesearchaeota archaeon]|nr:hypothetical protein [Candidatus Woesearchaeota archaeon]
MKISKSIALVTLLISLLALTAISQIQSENKINVESKQDCHQKQFKNKKDCVKKFVSVQI